MLQWSFWRTDSEILYKLAECFNINLKQSCFSDCWKFLSVVLVLKNFGEISAIKNYSSVIILFVVSNTLKITGLLINRLYYFEKCGLFSDFQYVMSSSSAEDLLTVVSNRIGRTFDRATRIIALDISKVLDWFWHDDLLYKLKSSYRIFKVEGLALFCIFSVINSFKWLQMEIPSKNIQLMMVLLEASFLVLHFSN